MARILYHGIGPEQPTGYGVQTKLFTTALAKAGHEVIISNFNSNFGYTAENGLRVVANGARSKYGNAMIREHVKRIQPDLVLTMFDIFICKGKEYQDLPWVAWNVIDCAPLHPQLKAITKVPKMLLAMSKFGQVTMANAGHASEYVPLAIDPKEYCFMDQQMARALLMKEYGKRIPEFFVVMVAANMSFPSRKNFHGAFKAWKLWTEAHPGKGLMYVHTEVTGTQGQGENLVEMADMCGMNPDILVFPDQYRYNQSGYSADYMKTLYAAADVLLCPSLGEGFCVPLVEAQCVGCPVIAPNATSTAELIDDATGIALVDLWPVAARGASEQWLPSIREMAGALEVRGGATRFKPETREALAQRYQNQFNVDHVTKTYLQPALAKALDIVRKSKSVSTKENVNETSGKFSGGKVLERLQAERNRGQAPARHPKGNRQGGWIRRGRCPPCRHSQQISTLA